MRSSLGLVALWGTACVPVDEKTTEDTDGTTAGDDDDTTPAGDDDDDDGPPGGSVAACAGDYTGTYDGYESGAFEATLNATAMTLAISDVEESGLLDGVADVQADGTLYGESQGIWIDGSIDLDTCAMSGEWGSTALPGVPGGTWRTD